MALNGAQRIADLEEASSLQSEDQFLFFQNSTKTTKRVGRDKMLLSGGVITTLQSGGLGTADAIAPNVPQGLILTSSSSTGTDGSENIIITAKITPNSDSDLESYSWYLREIDVAPVFVGGILTSGGTSSQTPTYEISAKNIENISGTNYAVKVFRGLKANKWYLVKVAAIDKSGNYSDYTSATAQSAFIESAKDNDPPGAPALHGTNHATNPSTSAIKSVFLRWTNPTAADLARIDIYRADGPSFSAYNKIGSAYGTAWTDSSTAQSVTYRYRLKAIDYSGNESGFSTVSPDPGGGINYVQITPNLVAATDITNFAVDATKLNTNTIVLQGSNIWSGNTTLKTISWATHTLVYQGASYIISASSTGSKYVYWKKSNIPNTIYLASDTNPDAATLGDDGFVIATNVGTDGNASGIYDLAWNSLANAVIGTAWIQNAAVTNAKISELNADKIRSGEITSNTITLGESGGSQGIINSSGATSATNGTGFWIQGGASPVFAIGVLNGAPSMRFSSGALTVKGRLESSTGFFGNASDNGVSIDDTGLSIVGNGSNGINVRLRANIDWENSNSRFTQNSNGFYLGKAGTVGGNSVYRFFIGNTGSSGTGGQSNYLYWDGSVLRLGGNLVGGTSVGSSGDTVHGLTIYSPYGLRKGRSNSDDDGVLTITGGEGNGIYYGGQIDLVGAVYTSDGNLSGEDGSGQVIIQAGYRFANPQNYVSPSDGAIVFRTSRENNPNSSGNNNHAGAQRFRIELDGTVRVVYTPSATSIGDTTAGRVFWEAPNSNRGRFIVEGQTSATNVEINNGVLTLGVNANFYSPSNAIVKSDANIEALSYTTVSSVKTKTNIKKYKRGLADVNRLSPISFVRKKDKKNDIGLIAEEVEKIVPKIVSKNDDGDIVGLDYSKLSILLINAVKELSLEIDSLKKEIKNAKRRN